MRWPAIPGHCRTHRMADMVPALISLGSSTAPSRCARTTGPVGELTGCPQRPLEPFQKSCGRCAGWARLREPACFRQDLECAGLTALFRQRPTCRSASPSSQAFGECVTGLKSGVEPPQSKTSRTSPKTRRKPAPVCFGANGPTRELTGCPQRRLGDRYCESNSSASECRATRTSRGCGSERRSGFDSFFFLRKGMVVSTCAGKRTLHCRGVAGYSPNDFVNNADLAWLAERRVRF